MRPTILKSANPRTRGERIVRRVFKDNRILRLTLDWNGMSGTYASWIATLHNIVALLENVSPDTPAHLQFQLTGSSTTYYATILAGFVAYEYKELLAAQLLDSFTVELECYPTFFGAPVTLQNLLSNPGFEAPAGGGTATSMPLVFTDSFANTNAYTTAAGSAPSVASNVMSVPNGTTLLFGSPLWGPIQQWQVRFKWVTGLSANFYIHYTDANNLIRVNQFTDNNLYLTQVVGGSIHNLTNAVTSPVNGTFYWLQVTMWPSVSGNAPQIQVTMRNDSAGAPGSTIATLGPIATFDSVTAMTGQTGFSASGAALAVGGNFSNVNTVSLFGPGGWIFVTNDSGAPGTTSGAWDGSRWELGMSGILTATTYTGGPVKSFGAARMDTPPAGNWAARWNAFNGGSPTGSNALPVSAAGNVIAASCYVRGLGLAATTSLILLVREVDASGNILRQTNIQTLAGNLANGVWTPLSGTVTTGANCAYVDVELFAADSSGGGHSATVWWDNVQVYNQTTTGQASMPYCELRFPNSPAQLMVSGLVGDTWCPVALALGTYLSSWAAASTLKAALGRRATATASGILTTPTAHSANNATVPTLDAGSYGGFYLASSGSVASITPIQFMEKTSDGTGTYHLLTRFYTGQSTGNIGNVKTRVVDQLQQSSSFASGGGLWASNGAFGYPLTTGAVWAAADSGLVSLPPTPNSAYSDTTQIYNGVYAEWDDATGGGSAMRINWGLLLPVDTPPVVLGYNNPSGGSTVSSKWLWTYVDGLPIQNGQQPALLQSQESTSLPNAAHAYGGAGTTTGTYPNVNSAGEPYFTLDPTCSVGTTTGINQFAGYVTDGNAAVYALHAEMTYLPLYVQPK